jgi:hypothetical protein
MRHPFRASLLVATFALVLAPVASVDAAPKAIVATPTLAAVPAAAVTQDARVRKLLAPSAKTKIAALEKKIGGKRYATESVAEVLADTRGAVTEQFGNADIEALVLIVMMNAAKDAEADLQNVMSSMQKLNAARKALREEMERLKKEGAKLGKKGPKPAWLATITHAKTPLGFAYEVLPATAATTCATPSSPDACLDEDQQKSDTLDDLGEQLQLQLQMAMDRRSKFLTTLSNIMKKVESTSDTIIQNFK